MIWRAPVARRQQVWVGRTLGLGLGVGLAALVTASSATAGGAPSGGGLNCGCVPTGHNVTVPGVNITPPTVTVNASSVAYATATATSSASVSSLANASALSSGVIYNGGGSNWYVEQGNSGVIPNLQVEGAEAGEARQICTDMRSAERVVAIQAVCLDDKSVPHPASQVLPDRDVGVVVLSNG